MDLKQLNHQKLLNIKLFRQADLLCVCVVCVMRVIDAIRVISGMRVVPVINVTKAKSNLVERTICNLLCLSDIIPPKSENSNIGAKFAVITKPSIISESVNVLISHSLPYTNDHIPIFENNAAIQNNLYSWYLKQ